jgi:hypothetical protein
MLNRTIICATLLLLFLAPAWTVAQDYEFNVAPKIGWMFLRGEPVGEISDNNWCIGGDAILWLPSNVGIGVDVKYFTKDVDREDSGDYDVDWESSIMPISFNAYFRSPQNGSQLRYYLGGGLSWVRASLSAVTDGLALDTFSATIEQDENVWGYNVVLGLQFSRLFVEAQYISASSEFEELQILTPDGDEFEVGGFNFMVGYRF